jgi:hypothetical protein
LRQWIRHAKTIEGRRRKAEWVMVGDTGSHGAMSSSEEIKIMEDAGEIASAV